MEEQLQGDSADFLVGARGAAQIAMGRIERRRTPPLSGWFRVDKFGAHGPFDTAADASRLGRGRR